jgi:GT2 family glycosyltransferase
VIVVDNGSTDNSADALATSLPRVNLVRSEWNRGFAGGNNLGAKVARGRYFAFLNSDTLLIDDSLASLVAFADAHPEIGILSPVLYLEDGKTIQSTAIAGFQTLLSVVTRRHTKHVIDLGREFQYVDLVAGAAMVVRRGLFQELGGFDEGIFMYLEDDDICKRAADLGMRTAVYARASVIHLGGRSISTGPARKRIYYRSQNYYWLKHHGLLPTLVMRCVRLPYRLVRERWG